MWLMLLPVAGEPATVLKTTDRIDAPAFSPDGQRLAIASLRNDRSEVFIVYELPNCSAARQFPVHAVRVSPHWVHDGSGIAFVPRVDPANIWVQPLDGKAPYALTHFSSGHALTNFAWSHDGKRLAIARFTTTNDIVLFKGLKSR